MSEKYNGLTKITSSINDTLNIYFQIFCLLYADGTILLAESAKKLQIALDGLHTYCNTWSLKVNVDKTKIMIFSKGRIRRFNSFFKFGENKVDVVDDYVYLGTTFNFNGKFNKAMARQVLQAKKATFSLIDKVKSLNLPIDMFVELFEKVSIPVLLYGSEVWGYENTRQLQVMVNNVMRRTLRLNKSTSVCMINGELGLKEITEFVENRMLNYWCNIATGEEKMSSILYKWIKTLYDQNLYVSPWLDKIKNTLDHIGMSYLFNNITNTNRNWFKNSVKQRLSDIYHQKWKDTVFSNSTCINYTSMTAQRKMQRYLSNLPSQYIYVTCKFKCSNHKMPIVTGRYQNIPIDDRKCTLCEQNDIGDEFHYLLECPFFQEDRVRYIKRFYYTHPNMDKMNKLFNETSNKDMFKLSKFIYIIIQHFKK